jgi:hypothetical protein
MKEKNKYYWDLDRNKPHDGCVDYSETKVPNYYVGKVYGYEARKVIEDFDLSYNIGTAISYLLRANNKHNSPIDCIQKAINHLEFELDKIKNINK